MEEVYEREIDRAEQYERAIMIMKGVYSFSH